VIGPAPIDAHRFLQDTSALQTASLLALQVLIERSPRKQLTGGVEASAMCVDEACRAAHIKLVNFSPQTSQVT
jgi:hypothetical protein